ncbi:MAG: transglycosylase domain-containing protein, partial [Bacteroidales bacterium]|nr:transglycosylase domain-containing protein [Bacteroidales bacterium]
ALVATEDVRYYEHHGIDPRSTLRVLVKTIILFDRSSGGGSTITQQLAKNLYGRKDFGIMTIPVAKIKEMILARRIEKLYSKNEILELYLNTVSFGENTYGIETASIIFFNKQPSELKIEESAMLVGLLKANTSYNPRTNKEAAIKRRNIVLGQMHKYGYLRKEELDSLKQIPISIKYRKFTHVEGLAPYFREYLRKRSLKILEAEKKPDGSIYNLYTDGLKVYTTLNGQMQDYLEQSVAGHLSKLQITFDDYWNGEEPWIKNPKLALLQIEQSQAYKSLIKKGLSQDEAITAMKVPRNTEIFTWNGIKDTLISPLDSLLHHFKTLQIGSLVMNGHTGDILAWVGGVNYKYFKYDHVTSKRQQVGSTFKPFLYTLAMQEGEFSPCSKFANVQPRIELITGVVWEPANDNDERKGEEITLKYALATSNNWISGHLIKRYSPQSVIKMARKMGVNSPIPPVYSIALGSADLKLTEMVGAMNSFASKGVYVEPKFITRIEDKNGNVIADFIPKREEAMSEETAYLMLELMKGVIKYGTGRRLGWKYGFRHPIAGKTGTTNNQSDGWFMGITPQLTTGVWVGNEDRSVHFRTITLGQGSNMALPIWALYMQKVYADTTLNINMGDFEPPIHGLNVEVDCDKIGNRPANSGNEFDEEEEF